jgi:CBS domain-containing protein
MAGRKRGEMASVSQLLKSKGREVFTVRETATVFDAIGKMESNNVGALVVLEAPGDATGREALHPAQGGRPCGMITERDYLRKVALKGRASRTTFVKEIMSTDLVSVEGHTDLEECMSLITRRRIRHLPVIENGRLVGLVSIGDVVRHLARDRQRQIEDLTAYIQGRYS